MERYLKFLAMLDGKRRMKVIEVLSLIHAGNLATLDIKQLQGWDNLYRCRTGKVRIIFRKTANTFSILDVDFRSSVYKRLKR